MSSLAKFIGLQVRFTRYSFVYCVVFVAVVCSVFGRPSYFVSVRTADMLPVEIDILEPVLRRQVANQGKHGKASIFVLIENENAPPEFLKRLHDLNVPLYPGSLYRSGNGVLLRLRLVRLSEDYHAEVEVQAGFYYADEGAQLRYFLTRKNGVWVVAKEELALVS